MGLLATLSHLSSKTIKKSEYDQATSEFAMAYDNRELVDGSEAEYDQATPEFAMAYDNRELVDGSEAEYGQVTSEFATYYDNRELVDGTEAEFDQIISDLYKRAEDQCNQFISNIKKAFETDLEYADACCGLGSAYEDKGEYDFTELQEDDTQMKTIKHFRLHIETCDIYAIEQRDDTSLVGSCGPLVEDDLKDLNSYDYSDKQNGWVQKNLDRLILWFP